MPRLAIVATNPEPLSPYSAQFAHDIRNASGVRDSVSGFNDNARFASVVMPHLDAAYNLALWLTGNGTDAEDVVQDASLRAFRAIRGFAGGSARAWVLSIVRNTAYSWLRKNRPSAVVTVEDLEAVEVAHAMPGDPDAETPEATLIAKADAGQLRAAIVALPTPFRETLVQIASTPVDRTAQRIRGPRGGTMASEKPHRLLSSALFRRASG